MKTQPASPPSPALRKQALRQSKDYSNMGHQDGESRLKSPSNVSPGQWLKAKVPKSLNIKSPLSMKSPLSSGIKAVNKRLRRKSFGGLPSMPNLDQGDRNQGRRTSDQTSTLSDDEWDEYLPTEARDMSPELLACLEHGMDEDEL